MLPDLQPSDTPKDQLFSTKLSGKKQNLDITVKTFKDSYFISILDTLPQLPPQNITLTFNLIDDFIEQFLKVNDFVKSKSGAIDKAQYLENPKVFSTKFITSTQRKYFFDLFFVEDFILQIINIYSKNRKEIKIHQEHLEGIIKCLFELKSLWSQVKNCNSLSFGGQISTPGMLGSLTNRMGSETQLFKPDYQALAGKLLKKKPMEVIQNPSPLKIYINHKAYLLEFVKGVNTFLRISEFEGDDVKGRLHVPIAIVSEFTEKMSDMWESYYQCKNRSIKPEPEKKI